MDYVLDEILRTGQFVIVESNFKADLDAPRFARLRVERGVTLIEVLCWAQGDVIFERYKPRIDSGDRHPGHAEVGSLDVVRAGLAPGRADECQPIATAKRADRSMAYPVGYLSGSA